MSRTIDITGLDEFVSMLEVLGESEKRITSTALYEAAAIAADAVTQAVSALPEEEDRGPVLRYRGDPPYQVITPQDKAAMIEAVGIAKFTRSGDSVDTAVGIGGYGGHTERKYPGGVPIPLIARSIESGSSVRAKNPFFRKAISGAKGAIKAKMVEIAEKVINEITGGK